MQPDRYSCALLAVYACQQPVQEGRREGQAAYGAAESHQPCKHGAAISTYQYCWPAGQVFFRFEQNLKLKAKLV